MTPMATIIAVGLFALSVPVLAADSAPQPPCGAEAWPLLPAVGAPPAVRIWRSGDLKKSGWTPPACTGWSASSDAKLVLALAASFRYAGASEELLGRIGSISSVRSVRYWSATDKAWRPLVLEAGALAGPDSKNRRADFLPSEMIPGTKLFYWENDSRSGAIVYDMQVIERTPERIVVGIENVSPVRLYLVTLFKPHEFQTVEILERRAGDVWGAYLLTRIGAGASRLALGNDASYINRAVALYRHVAGIQTDLEPPAAR